MEIICLAVILTATAAAAPKVSTGDCTTGKQVTTCRNVTLKENRPLEITNYTNILKLNPPLKDIPPRAFVLLPNLKILIINYTLMEKIYSTSFSGLKNLQELDLFWNQIPNIPLDAFRDCPNLIYLNLGGNNLENINGDVFAHLKHLKKLIISSNQLSSVPQLSDLSSLEFLDLSKNKITRLDEDSFNGLDSLINLNLKSNEMTYIERNAFYGLTKLKFLNLERNNLDKIDDGNVRQNLPNLLEIRLNMNDFCCEDLEVLVRNFMQAERKIFVPEGLAEPGPISHHGMFCLPKIVAESKKALK